MTCRSKTYPVTLENHQFFIVTAIDDYEIPINKLADYLDMGEATIQRYYQGDGKPSECSIKKLQKLRGINQNMADKIIRTGKTKRNHPEMWFKMLKADNQGDWETARDICAKYFDGAYRGTAEAKKKKVGLDVDGDKLKAWRERTGHARKHVADYVGLTDYMYRQVEQGLRGLKENELQKLEEFSRLDRSHFLVSQTS